MTKYSAEPDSFERIWYSRFSKNPWDYLDKPDASEILPTDCIRWPKPEEERNYK